MISSIRIYLYTVNWTLLILNEIESLTQNCVSWRSKKSSEGHEKY